MPDLRWYLGPAQDVHEVCPCRSRGPLQIRKVASLCVAAMQSQQDNVGRKDARRCIANNACPGGVRDRERGEDAQAPISAYGPIDDHQKPSHDLKRFEPSVRTDPDVNGGWSESASRAGPTAHRVRKCSLQVLCRCPLSLDMQAS